MTYLKLHLPIFALLCSTSFAQEVDTKNTKPEMRREAARSSGQRRGPTEYSFKDPAAFKVTGGDLFSGPQIGESIPEFKATTLTGKNANNEISPLDAGETNLQIVFFQDDTGVAIRGLFGVARVASAIEQNFDKPIGVKVVFLADEPETITSKYGRLYEGMEDRGIDIVAASLDGRDGPGSLGLNRTVAQTVLLVRDGKVTRNFVFPEGMLYPDPHLLGGIAELIGMDRQKVASSLLASGEGAGEMRMRATSSTSVNQDQAKNAFREKLGEFVRSGKITRAEAGELYRAAFPE